MSQRVYHDRIDKFTRISQNSKLHNILSAGSVSPINYRSVDDIFDAYEYFALSHRRIIDVDDSRGTIVDTADRLWIYYTYSRSRGLVTPHAAHDNGAPWYLWIVCSTRVPAPFPSGFHGTTKYRRVSFPPNVPKHLMLPWKMIIREFDRGRNLKLSRVRSVIPRGTRARLESNFHWRANTWTVSCFWDTGLD